MQINAFLKELRSGRMHTMNMLIMTRLTIYYQETYSRDICKTLYRNCRVTLKSHLKSKKDKPIHCPTLKDMSRTMA